MRAARTTLATALALAIASFPASPAHARTLETTARSARSGVTQRWTPPVELTSRTEILGSSLAIDGRGVAVAVWATPEGVSARRRTPGAGWLAPERLDAGYAPRVASNARGDLVAAWVRSVPGQEEVSVLRASRRPAGGDWTRPVTLGRGTTAFNTDVPVVAIGPGGSASVAISIGRHPHPWLPTIFTFARGRWSGPVRMSSHRGWALDLAAGPDGVRVNCISPSAILTDRTAANMPELVQKQVAASHPLRRIGLPEDVAAAALFLASSSAGWITGATLDVAGGRMMH